VGGTTTSYTWDALGRRLSKVAGTVTTVFANEGSRENARALAEYDNGAFARLYIYGGDARDEVLVMKAGTAKYYFTHGAQYSVQAVTNDAGAVIERYRYDAFGKQTVLNASGATILGTTIANRVGFTGRYHDETGLVFFRTRLFDPRLGRFIARDDDFFDGANLYMAYFVPNALDPSGRFGWGDLNPVTLAKDTYNAGANLVGAGVDLVTGQNLPGLAQGVVNNVLGGGGLGGLFGGGLGAALGAGGLGAALGILPGALGALPDLFGPVSVAPIIGGLAHGFGGAWGAVTGGALGAAFGAATGGALGAFGAATGGALGAFGAAAGGALGAGLAAGVFGAALPVIGDPVTLGTGLAGFLAGRAVAASKAGQGVLGDTIDLGGWLARHWPRLPQPPIPGPVEARTGSLGVSSLQAADSCI
jgi:RHS repeat-associated protein